MISVLYYMNIPIYKNRDGELVYNGTCVKFPDIDYTYQIRQNKSGQLEYRWLYKSGVHNTWHPSSLFRTDFKIVSTPPQFENWND